MAETLGFIGLGNMGIAMAENLQKHLTAQGSPSLVVYNRTASRAEPLRQQGAQVASSVSEIAQKATIIFSCLANDEAVKQTYDELLNAINDGSNSVIVEMSTVAPETTIAVSEAAKKRGVALLACPIFGPPAKAKSAELIVVTSGPKEALARVHDYLVPVLGKSTIDVGQDIRQALRLKLVGNFFITSMVETLAEGLTLGEASGLGQDKVHEFLHAMFAGTPFAAYSDRMVYETYNVDLSKGERPQFSITGASKDVRHALQLAKDGNAKLPISEAMLGHLNKALDKKGDIDISSVVGIILQSAGFDTSKTLPTQVLTDVFARYIGLLATTTTAYAHVAGRQQANGLDLARGFTELGIGIDELKEWFEKGDGRALQWVWGDANDPGAILADVQRSSAQRVDVEDGIEYRFQDIPDDAAQRVDAFYTQVDNDTLEAEEDMDEIEKDEGQEEEDVDMDAAKPHAGYIPPHLPPFPEIQSPTAEPNAEASNRMQVEQLPPIDATSAPASVLPDTVNPIIKQHVRLKKRNTVHNPFKHIVPFEESSLAEGSMTDFELKPPQSPKRGKTRKIQDRAIFDRAYRSLTSVPKKKLDDIVLIRPEKFRKFAVIEHLSGASVNAAAPPDTLYMTGFEETNTMDELVRLMAPPNIHAKVSSANLYVDAINEAELEKPVEETSKITIPLARAGANENGDKRPPLKVNLANLPPKPAPTSANADATANKPTPPLPTPKIKFKVTPMIKSEPTDDTKILGIQDESIQCICDHPHLDDGKFMIACDNCSNWFHGECRDMGGFLLVLFVVGCWAQCDTNTDQFSGVTNKNLTVPGSFSLTYHNTYKVVTHLPTGDTWALASAACNSTVPSNTFKSLVTIPVSKVGVIDVDAVGFLELLGQESSIVAASSPSNITNCVNTSNLTPLDVHALNTGALDVVFSENTALSDPKMVYTAMNSSQIPLDGLMWMHFFAAFYNAESLAVNITSTIQDYYDCYRNAVQNISNPMHIAWVNWDPTGATWHIRNDSYTVALFSARPVDGSTDTYTDKSAFVSTISNADVVIDTTPDANLQYQYWQGLAGISGQPTYPFFMQKQVYTLDLLTNNGYSDWPVRSLARPDLVLQDIIKAQYNTFPEISSFTWFRNIAQSATSQPITNSYQCHGSDIPPLSQCNVSPFAGNSASPTSSSTPNSSPDSSSTGGLSGGAKAGIAIAVIAVAAAAGTAGLLFWKKRRTEPDHNFSLLGQLWKEYAKGDSKYLNDDDELVYVLESLTVFLWGPLCIFAAYLMYRGKRAKRVATAVCMAHLASCSIYLVSDALRGFPNTRPEALYFWGYLWAFNLPWIVVPWWILTH
ncbi:hypothetical protein BZG36_03589 [Bifiguratus adelaidae]|uniref:EXPERA domain-containing protein n=1 Tax=Bifiguratus adelaidae TaxID=1938954 RepID=A0A261XYK6_9FUNG|nr:hypothetical protein BZG36_03589 [Bifiguratus adelaidae]